MVQHMPEGLDCCCGDAASSCCTGDKVQQAKRVINNDRRDAGEWPGTRSDVIQRARDIAKRVDGVWD